MELRHLRSFLVVARHLHFARAAEELDISAPTITAQIQELERMLDVRLFHRTKRSVQLTTAGEAFLPEAEHALAQVERSMHVAQRAGRGQLGRVEIGYVASAAFFGILQDQVQRFRARWPDVLISTQEVPTGQLLSQLEEGRIDLGFVRMPVQLPDAVASHVLARDRFCVALPVGHVLAKTAGTLPAKALARESFVVPEQPLGLQEVARRGRFVPRIVSSPGSLLAVLTQVALGEGVAVVPSVLVQVITLPGVVFRDLAGARIPSEVAALHRRHERSPAVLHFIAQIRASVASERA